MDDRTKLYQIQKASGLTQQALATEIGTSLVSLNNWLSGGTKPTRKAFLARIDALYVKYLGLDAINQGELHDVKQKAEMQRLTATQLVANPRALRRLTVASTYNNDTIEGSTMTEADVDAVLFSRRTLTNRTQIEQREAVNHRVALEYLLSKLTENEGFQFTPDLIERVHLLLMSGIISNAGTWRNHEVRIQGSHVALANYVKIPALIEVLCAELNMETDDQVALLAKTHAQFEQIHPFSDGNGRAGRLIMLAKALQLSIAPPIVEQERKAVYYKYLQLAQSEGKHDFLEQLVAESILTTSAQLRPLLVGP